MEQTSGAETALLDVLTRIDKRMASLQTTLTFMSMGPEAVMQFVYQDHRIRLWLPDAVTDNIQRYIMEKRGFHEEALLTKAKPHLMGCRSALDVGANIGNHTVFFSKVLGIERIVSFEPQAHVFDILTRNIELNDLPGVVAEQKALGEKTGKANMVLHRNTSFHGTAYREADDGDVDVYTIDDLVDEPVDFIKIDVEGMQMSVLRGAEQVLRAHRPKLWIELRRNHNEFAEADEFLRGLDVGYSSTALSGDDHLFAVK